MGSNDRSLRDGFVALGHRCCGLDSSRLVSPPRWSQMHLRKRVFGSLSPAVLSSFRSSALDLAGAVCPDLIVVFKGTWLEAETARRLGSLAPIIDFHPDDIGNAVNVTPGYLESIPHFAVSVTHRRENVGELESLGARRVLLLAQAFDPNIHVALPGIKGKRWDVSFVGSCRPEREQALEALAKQTHLRLRVAGHGWRRGRLPGVTVTGPAWGMDMTRIISSSTMSIGFVNHQNRDLRTYRSFEVPAIGSLLLAERTSEHEEIFQDGLEAVFFSSIDELIDRACYYSVHQDEAAVIAQEGHGVVARLNATYQERAAQLLTAVASDEAGTP